MALITIFTPTFNRAYILNNCYESLVEQSSKNFIWQIIDDGSTDDTKRIVSSFMQKNLIEIEYIFKENGGKASAINESMKITKTPLWVCLDSDDYLLENAIEKIETEYCKIKDKQDICGLFGLRFNKNGRPMQGVDIPNKVEFATQFDIRYKYKIPPEYLQVYKTNIIKKYEYPIFHNEKYMPLSYTQDQIDRKYKFYILKMPIMICEYLEDGITKNHRQLVKKYPLGYTEFRRQQMIYAPTFRRKLVACITYVTGGMLCENKNWLKESPCKMLTLFCFPVGYLNFLLRYKNIRI